jgi:hypothetical protein
VQVIDDVADDAPEDVVDHTAALTTDLVRQYLNDAGRHALLTKEDEADLAKRYQAGLAADQLLKEHGTDSPAPARPGCARSAATAPAPRSAWSRRTCGWSCRRPASSPVATSTSSS